MAVGVLATLYLLMKGKIVQSALVFGVAVFFKFYPIIYAIPIWFGIDHFVESFKNPNAVYKFRFYSRSRFVFGGLAAATFLLLNLAMYQL
jgi:phosphatidylinositol glycan class M